MNYNQYLQTTHWQEKRTEKLLHRPFCQICNSTSTLNVHHKKYKEVLFNERKENLISLCSSCHRMIHFYFGIEVNKINKKILRIRRLMELGISKKTAFYIVSKDITGDLFISIRNKLSN